MVVQWIYFQLFKIENIPTVYNGWYKWLIFLIHDLIGGNLIL